MKKLSPEEYELLPIKGKGRSSHVFNSIINLKAGEAVLIERKDWKRKAAPGSLIKYIEKKHNMKFSCGAINDGSGWAVKRIDQHSPAQQTSSVFTNERLQLKSDILIFYIGRMGFHKIERIEDSVKAAVNHFWKNDNVLVKELFFEIIKGLSEQGHIVIENEKTYIPLRRN
ncbi:MAG: hypothetical protein K0Q95_382 [Bacteroidota bacterium]|jgi:hypothetical protein|nr:hypothetical protein [Bacteroidota bacterium]